MKKLLVTGFDPFGGESINPAWEAVKRLPDEIGQWQIHRLMVPTVFGKAYETAAAEAERIGAEGIVCVGQAGGRKAVTPEMIGVNLRYGSIADNEGQSPKDEPCVPMGPAAYFATLPVRRMAEAIKAKGIEASVSYSAGAFVCNDLLYSLLHQYNGTGIPVGFIHVPFLPQQAKEGVPSMALETIVEALVCAIDVL